MVELDEEADSVAREGQSEEIKNVGSRGTLIAVMSRVVRRSPSRQWGTVGIQEEQEEIPAQRSVQQRNGGR